MKEIEFECDECVNYTIVRGLYVAEDIKFCPICGADVSDNVQENGEYEE